MFFSKKIIVGFLFAGLTAGLAAESFEIDKRAKKFPDFEKRLDWSWKGACKEISNDRMLISLNGYWNFYPAMTPEETMPVPCDLYYKVPAQSCRQTLNYRVRTKDGKPLAKLNGKNLGWDMPHNYIHYRRTIDIPEKQENKIYNLYVELITCKSFSVKVNGKNVPIPPAFFSGRLPITDYLKFGAVNTIELDLEMDPKAGGGISGNLMIEIMPKLHLGEPAIQTLVSEKKVEVAFFNRTIHQTGVSLDITISDAKTGVEVFSKNGLPLQDKIVFNYLAPNLWTPNTPDLYYMTITAKDHSGKRLETLKRRFGFREFTLQGAQYMLNGKPFFLRGVTDFIGASGWGASAHRLTKDYFRRYFRNLKGMNLNFCYTKLNMYPSFFDAADEEGFILLMQNDMGYDTMWGKDDEFVYRKLDNILRNERKNSRLMNHPSQCGMLIDVWFNMHAGTMNPEYIGRKYSSKSYASFDKNGNVIRTAHKDPNLEGMRIARKNRLDHMVQIYGKYFPEFRCFTGASAETGGIFGLHVYHTWGAQPMEVRALFSRWGMQPELPIFIGEFFIPYWSSMRRINVMNGPKSTAFYLENTARFFGNKAYRYKTSYKTTTMHDWSIRNATKDTDGTTTYSFLGDYYEDLLYDISKHIIPGFLYSGANGIGTFGHAEEAYGGQLRSTYHTFPMSKGNLSSMTDRDPEVISFQHLKYPVFDFLGKNNNHRFSRFGIPFFEMMDDHYAAFFNLGNDPYAEDHAYFSGTRLNKKLTVFNHSPETVVWNGTFFFRRKDGSMVSKRSFQVKVPFAGRADIPVEDMVPYSAVRESYDLKAVLNSEDGKTRTANFTFEVFPVMQKPLNGLQSKLYVYDPEKVLVKKLRDLGAEPKIVKNIENMPDRGIFVIARKALEHTTTLPLFTVLANKGLNILVMEQSAKSSYELKEVRCRNAFINAEAHPVFNDLKNQDFQLWRGCYSTADAYGVNTKRGLNWSNNGNRNMVASFTFRRPTSGNYKSLLVSGFDLYQSPLLEYVGKKASILLSQLEITDRIGIDPAAEKIFVNMLHYLDSRSEFSRKTAFFGNSAGLELMKKLHVDAEEIKTADEKTLKAFDTLIISDPDFKRLDLYRFELASFVFHGGNIFYLHAGKKWQSTWLPFAMKMKQVKTRGSFVLADNPDFFWRNGWDANDLYWHDEFSLPAFEAVRQIDAVDPAVAVRRPYGSGNFIFTTIHPRLFGKTPAQGKAVRTLSAMLSSLGVGISHENQPYKISHAIELDLSPYRWEFALDPENKALKEEWEKGKNGSGKWMQGQISNDGTHVRVGIPIEQFLKGKYDGYMMFRLKFSLDPDFLKEKVLYFQAGCIDDFDEVYINGVKIGQTGKETANWWLAPRCYRIPQGVLKSGENLIAIRIFDNQGEGGITKLPVSITSNPSLGTKAWIHFFPEGSDRDYSYNPDIIRSY